MREEILYGFKFRFDAANNTVYIFYNEAWHKCSSTLKDMLKHSFARNIDEFVKKHR